MKVIFQCMVRCRKIIEDLELDRNNLVSIDQLKFELEEMERLNNLGFIRDRQELRRLEARLEAWVDTLD